MALRARSALPRMRLQPSHATVAALSRVRRRFPLAGRLERPLPALRGALGRPRGPSVPVVSPGAELAVADRRRATRAGHVRILETPHPRCRSDSILHGASGPLLGGVLA